MSFDKKSLLKCLNIEQFDTMFFGKKRIPLRKIGIMKSEREKVKNTYAVVMMLLECIKQMLLRRENSLQAAISKIADSSLSAIDRRRISNPWDPQVLYMTVYLTFT